MLETKTASTNAYIDIHFHILPGVDDGARNIEMALQMARLAIQDGTRTIVATPHPDARTGIGSKEKTLQATFDFSAIMRQQGITDLQVLPGVECYLVPELFSLLKEDKVFTLNNSRYLLLEFNHVIAPVNVEKVMFHLRTQGYIPIVAHPERYKYAHDNLKWLERLVRLGCLIQVTAGSYYGRFGKQCQKTATLLLQSNLAHIVASDAHNLEIRAPGLSQARPVIEKLAGPDTFRQMAIDVPARIVENLVYEPDLPDSPAGRSFWKFW
jgi:protein-tyrosine phosphatase